MAIPWAIFLHVVRPPMAVISPPSRPFALTWRHTTSYKLPCSVQQYRPALVKVIGVLDQGWSPELLEFLLNITYAANRDELKIQSCPFDKANKFPTPLVIRIKLLLTLYHGSILRALDPIKSTLPDGELRGA